MKLWGGRFQTEKNALLSKMDNSFLIDKKLWEQDILCSMAHVTMLEHCNILKKDEAKKIRLALSEIQSDIRNGILPLGGDFEDIHSFIEYHVVKKIGDAGKKMHTARSRNDQVATDMKLYTKVIIQKIIEAIKNLQSTLQKRAEHSSFPMPGYTHMQHAQIITFKYYLLSYYEMLNRDRYRLENALKIMDTCPLGSGALAGSTHSLNRNFTAKYLGFREVQSNTIDSVSDRDYIIELLSDFGILMMHLSRLAEELILYSTHEFHFIKLSDSYSTGSSLMPQKKNPDSLELIRSKTGKIYGNLVGMLTVMKALPLSYNKDMQEDKSCFFESCELVENCLYLMSGIIETMEINQTAMKQASETGFLNATELADYLVGKNIPFRDAHEITGKIVLYCEQKKCEIHELNIEELQSFCNEIDCTVYPHIHPDTILYQGNKKDML